MYVVDRVPNDLSFTSAPGTLAADDSLWQQVWSALASAQQRNTILGLDTYVGDENVNPDWAQAKAQIPISFAIIKSGGDPKGLQFFKREWPKIKDAGIVRGAFLFLSFPHPKNGMKALDPVSQAKAFIKRVGNLDKDKSDLPPSLDVEFPGDPPRAAKPGHPAYPGHPGVSGGRLTGMTPRQLLDGVRAAWKVLKDYYGVAPIIYTSGRVWREDLSDLPAPDLVESPLWLVRYPWREKRPAVFDARVVSKLLPPVVPRPWGGPYGRAAATDPDNWWIHQYQGDALSLPGFHQVDMNRFNTMRLGATGERVKWVQRRLGIAQNGQFDAAMDSILRAFQNKHGLLWNGIVDLHTFRHLCWSNL